MPYQFPDMMHIPKLRQPTRESRRRIIQRKHYMQNRRERRLHLTKHPRYLVDTILHHLKDHGTITVHPEEPATLHVLLSQAVDPNSNTLLLLPWSNVSTCN